MPQPTAPPRGPVNWSWRQAALSKTLV